jgi:Fe-S cluster assembly scaffold protein SufB
MNKLILDKKIFNDMVIKEDSEIYFSNIEIDDLQIEIKDNVKVIINSFCNNISHRIRYILGSKASLIVNKLSVNGNDDIKVLLEGEGATVKYYYAHVNSLDSRYSISVYHHNKMTSSHLFNHGICLDQHKLSFLVNGYDIKDNWETIINQDNKIICLENNKASIEPNLYINNNEVEANHSAYIGKFNKDIVFYLMTRGLTKEESYRLLIKAFLIGDMDIDYEVKNTFLQVIKNIKE